MSKAFTRESDELPEQPMRLRQASKLPPGTKNYVTPAGARALREELDRLIEMERPAAAAAPDGSDPKRELQLLDQRIRYLQQSLQTAVVVPPPSTPWNQVRFGAVVTVRDVIGGEERYRLVGVDETDVERGWVSWLSPLAKALINARLGQRVRFKIPSGEREIEIVGIAYE